MDWNTCRFVQAVGFIHAIAFMHIISLAGAKAKLINNTSWIESI